MYNQFYYIIRFFIILQTKFYKQNIFYVASNYDVLVAHISFDLYCHWSYLNI